MTRIMSRASGFATLLLLAAAIPAGTEPAGAQPGHRKKAGGAVTLAATGTFALGGRFDGTITINRFEARGSEIVAIGFVRGALSRGGQSLGTALAGEVTLPVRLRVGNVSGVAAPATQTSSGARIAPVSWSPGSRARFGPVPVQAEVCTVLDVALGPVTVDLLGFQVTLDAVGFNLQGVVGTPLGDLVCAVSDLIGNVAAVVELLNSILALLTGLLGGLLGGIA